MVRNTRTSLIELMNELMEGINKINLTIHENIDLISNELRSFDSLNSSTEEKRTELKSKIKVNDSFVRSLGDALETLAIRILSLQAPVSRDLRRVISSFRMIYDLQRISRDAYNAFSDILDAGPKYYKDFKDQIINVLVILDKSKLLLYNFIEIYQLPFFEIIQTYTNLYN